MNPDDVWKTNFKTKFGLDEWKFMPFGLTNAPTTFLQLINDVFRKNLGRIVVIYLDEILIFNKACDIHMQHVRLILQILREHKLQVKEKKFLFWLDFSSLSQLRGGIKRYSTRFDPFPSLKEMATTFFG